MGYDIPSWIGQETLVLCSSYSGSTEETLATYDAAKAAGAPRVVATTGGELAERARADGVPVVPLPGGFQPRAAVGYSLVTALEAAALCGAAPSLRGEVEAAAALAAELAREWGPDGAEDGEAKRLARALHGTFPVIVGAGLTASVAYRWKCQINENAEVPAFASKLPEHDHNEIVGWAGGGAPPLGRLPRGLAGRGARDAPGRRHGRAGGRGRRRRRARERARRDAAGAARLARAAGRPDVALPRGAARGRPRERAGARRRQGAARRHPRLSRSIVAGMPDTATSLRTAASIIDGRERTDAPGGRLESTNPANRSDVVAEVLLTDAQGFVDACRAARAAQPAWGAVPAPIRGRVIAQVGRLVEANKEALSRLITREIGKPYPEALGEVQEIIDTCDFFLGEGRRLYGQTVPSEMPDKQLFTFRMPVGVAAIVTAGNFPGAVPSWYLVPAILCGNAVVWKPGRVQRRRSAPRWRSSCTPAACPKGVLDLVQADGAATFEGLETRARAAACSTRSASPARPPSGRRSARSAAATCSRPASSSAARTRWS